MYAEAKALANHVSQKHFPLVRQIKNALQIMGIEKLEPKLFTGKPQNGCMG